MFATLCLFSILPILSAAEGVPPTPPDTTTEIPAPPPEPTGLRAGSTQRSSAAVAGSTIAVAALAFAVHALPLMAAVVLGWLAFFGVVGWTLAPLFWSGAKDLPQAPANALQTSLLAVVGINAAMAILHAVLTPVFAVGTSALVWLLAGKVANRRQAFYDFLTMGAIPPVIGCIASPVGQLLWTGFATAAGAVIGCGGTVLVGAACAFAIRDTIWWQLYAPVIQALIFYYAIYIGFIGGCIGCFMGGVTPVGYATTVGIGELVSLILLGRTSVNAGRDKVPSDPAIGLDLMDVPEAPVKDDARQEPSP